MTHDKMKYLKAVQDDNYESFTKFRFVGQKTATKKEKASLKRTDDDFFKEFGEHLFVNYEDLNK